MDNIIQFPKTRAANKNKRLELDSKRLAMMHYEDMANEATIALTNALVDHGYHPIENVPMVKDLGVIMNLIVAMMYRVDGETHFLHEPMDEINEVIQYIKDLKKKKLLTDDLLTDDD